MPGVVHENVFRFDVPVHDPVLPAHLQRGAQVDAQADDPLLVHAAERHIPGQGRQQLHADEDIPDHFAFRLVYLVVVDPDDVRISLHGVHQLDLRREVAYHVAVVRVGLVLLQALRPQFLRLIAVPRDLRYLDGRGGRACQVLAHRLVHGREAALADLLRDPPFRPDLPDQFPDLFHFSFPPR